MNIFFYNYEIKDEISIKKETEIYRAYDIENKRNVILKIIKSTNEFNIAVVNLKNEFEILNMLSDHENILKTYDFQKYEEGYFLVVEDNTGITLDRYFKERSVTIIDFLKIAIKICEILFMIHKSKIIHKDVKPDNIIINPKN
jgi:serine/threonine protein kinase